MALKGDGESDFLVAKGLAVELRGREDPRRNCLYVCEWRGKEKEKERGMEGYIGR